MKQKLKQFTTLMAFCALLVLSSCEKDLYDDAIQNENRKLIIRDISLKDVTDSKINSKILNKVSEVRNSKNNAYGKIVYDSINDFYFDDEDGKYIESDDYHSYTFPIYRQNSDGKIEKVLFSLNKDGDYDIFLVKYDFTDLEMKTFSQSQISEKEMFIKDISGKNGFPDIICSYEYQFIETYNHGFTTADPGTHFEIISSGYYCYFEYNDEGGSGGGGDSPSNSTSGGHGNGIVILTTPSGSGGSASPGKKPCENLSNLANPSYQNITPSINFLIQQVVNNTPIEWGFDFEKTGPTSSLTQDSQFNYNNNQVKGSSNDVSMTYGPSYIGAAHCHTNNGVGLFSFADVRNLSLAFNAANYNIKKDVTSIVVIPNTTSPASPQIYAIKVDNYTALANAINADLTNPKYADVNLQLTIDNIKTDMAKTMQGSNFEISFLKKYSNFGISLYKATNNSFDSWSKLKVSPTSPDGIENVPCLMQKI